MDYLEQNNINVLPLPSKSPDLNPIEHTWDQWINVCASDNLHLRKRTVHSDAYIYVFCYHVSAAENETRR
jgi:transposase